MAFDWDKHPETVARLVELFNEGKSAAVMANILKNGLTRNACIGRLHRMGLKHEKTVNLRAAQLTKPKPVPKPPAPPQPPPDAPKPMVPAETWAERNGCSHITGHTNEPGWQMCGNPSRTGKAYCEYHYQKCIDLARMEASRRQTK